MAKYLSPPPKIEKLTWGRRGALETKKFNASIDAFNKYMSDNFIRFQSGMAFSVHKNGVSQTLTDNMWTKMTWSHTSYDTTGGIDLANDRWTCKQSGIYRFTLVAELTGNLPANKVFEIALYKNGINVAEHDTDHLSGTKERPQLQLERTLELNQTDYIEAYALEDSGGTRDLSGLEIYTIFQGERVT